MRSEAEIRKKLSNLEWLESAKDGEPIRSALFTAIGELKWVLGESDSEEEK
jgi:hypothetical protein